MTSLPTCALSCPSSLSQPDPPSSSSSWSSPAPRPLRRRAAEPTDPRDGLDDSPPPAGTCRALLPSTGGVRERAGGASDAGKRSASRRASASCGGVGRGGRHRSADGRLEARRLIVRRAVLMWSTAKEREREKQGASERAAGCSEADGPRTLRRRASPPRPRRARPRERSRKICAAMHSSSSTCPPCSCPRRQRTP